MQIPQCHPIRTDAQRLPVILFHQLVHIGTMGQLFQSSFDLANLTNRIFPLFEVPGQFRIDPSQISTKRIFIPQHSNLGREVLDHVVETFVLVVHNVVCNFIPLHIGNQRIHRVLSLRVGHRHDIAGCSRIRCKRQEVFVDTKVIIQERLIRGQVPIWIQLVLFFLSRTLQGEIVFAIVGTILLGAVHTFGSDDRSISTCVFPDNDTFFA